MSKYVLVLSDASGNHSTHKKAASSISDAKRIFREWMEEVGRYAEEANAEGLLYGCDPDHTRDAYPLYQLGAGQRNGVSMQPA